MMLKSVLDLGLNRVLSSRIQQLPLQLSTRFYSDGRYNKRGDGNAPTLRQKRIASEVKEVISQAMQQGSCQSPLLQRCGFKIRDVRMSSDLRMAFVLWKALPGMQRSAEKAALSKVKKLRSLVFERLNMPFSPTIKFQEDKVSPQMLALEEVFAKLKESETEGETESEFETEKQKEKDNSSTALL